MVIEFPVLNPDVVRIPQQVIHSVYSKRIAGDYLGEERFPTRELRIRHLFRANGYLCHIHRRDGRTH